MRHRPDAVLIAGPTASGKSALAMRFAEQLGGIVINADSMQVYRDLRIITARPTADDEARVPHRLFGSIDGNIAYSVSLWLADAAHEVERASAAGQMPIFVGGTGLFFKALTQGLSDIPPVPEAIRSEIRAWAAGKAPTELHAVLAERDPAMALVLRPTDPQRIVRALEVQRATGRSLSSFQERRQPPLLPAERCLAVLLKPDRSDLRLILERRFDRMITDGALDEVSKLADRKLDPALPILRALGVPSLMRYLAGTSDLASAITEAKADTRRYVKRQETFARHQLAGFRPVRPDQADELIAAELQL